jgi:hypothetical protein
MMPTLSEIPPPSPKCSSAAFDDDYSQFQQTYGPFESSEDKDNNMQTDDTMNDSDSSSTFWDLLQSLYLPIVVLWLRRSMFGTVNLIRSLIVGHLLRFFFGNVSEWMTHQTPQWMLALLQHPSNSHGKLDQSWPPPALTALALMTIFTLVVHPDGFTWIMLGKLR